MATYKKHISKSGELSYYIRAYDGRDINGKQIERSMVWKPLPKMTEKQIEKELLRQCTLFDEKVKQGLVLDGSTTFAQYAEIWMKNNEPPQLAPKTYERYNGLLKRILPAIGHIRLEKLQSHHLQAFYKQLASIDKESSEKAVSIKKTQTLLKSKYKTLTNISVSMGISKATVDSILTGKNVSINTAKKVAAFIEIPYNEAFKIVNSGNNLSDRTINHYHRLISSILSQATRDRIIPYNVADKDHIKAPKVEHREAKYLDEYQAQEVISYLFTEPIKWRTALFLLIYTGMRRGELCGLEWKDIDFENKKLHIRRCSQCVYGLGVITKEPKNITSNRTISISDDLISTLKEYRAWYAEERLKLGDLWHDSIDILDISGNITSVKNDRLFIADDSLPIYPDSITKWTSKFVKKYNLPDFTPHSLRHTNVTLQIAAGVPLRTISARAGHSQTSTTANIYSHAIHSADEEAAKAISNMLNISKKA